LPFLSTQMTPWTTQIGKIELGGFKSKRTESEIIFYLMTGRI
jgi:hypothetical protein